MPSLSSSSSSTPLSHPSPMNSYSTPSAGSSPSAHPPATTTSHHHHSYLHPMPFHNAVYYTYDGRPPSVALTPEIISIIYYPSATRVRSDGSVELADPQVDSDMIIDGTAGCLRALTNLKRRNPTLKVILSLNGREALRTAAASDECRQKFAASARTLVDLHGLDGIDIDWKYPHNDTEGINYLLLLRECRSTLIRGEYWLTTTMPPSPLQWVYGSNGVFRAAECVDLVNLICYDFFSNNAATSQAQLYSPKPTYYGYSQELSCYAAVEGLLQMQVPNSKIVLGVPVFGRTLSREANGLTHLPIPYKDLPWASADFDSQRGTASSRLDDYGVVSHDNPLSVNMKADFIRFHRLAGMFFVNANMDTPDQRGSLIHAGYLSLNQE